ncbi:MAG: sugar phosphate isomerase/epimerase family protein [Acidobacteriota bacterium]
MLFGVSTQLYHGQRLQARHLAGFAACGFRAVEIVATRSHLDYHDPRALDEVAGWLSIHGLHLHAIHAPVTERVENGRWGRAFSNASPTKQERALAVSETAAALELARRVPVSYLVVHVGLPNNHPDAGADTRDAARRSIEEIAELASPLGTRVALEVIPNALSTPESLAGLIEDELDALNLGVCLDVGHAHLMGDAVGAVETLSGLLVTTHVHDNRGTTDDHLPPMEGTIDWPGVVMALQKVGYDGVMMLEMAGRGETAPILERAAGAARRLEALAGSWS